MFSKALFKQSCKANGMMWAIVTVVTCFILAVVVLICGSGNITETKNAIQDTIVKQEIEAEYSNRAINYYTFASAGLECFDESYAAVAQSALEAVSAYSTWAQGFPMIETGESFDDYKVRVTAWQQTAPTADQFDAAAQQLAQTMDRWIGTMPSVNDYSNATLYALAVLSWAQTIPLDMKDVAASAYMTAMQQMTTFVTQQVKEYNENLKKENADLPDDSTALLNPDEYLFMTMCVLYPQLDEQNETGAAIKAIYDVAVQNGDSYPEYYDVETLMQHLSEDIQAGTQSDYTDSVERVNYRQLRAQELAGVFLAVNMTDQDNVDAILQQLASYGIDSEKYASFGYDYPTVKDIAVTGAISYRGRMEYEEEKIRQHYSTDSDGNIIDEEAYEAEVAAARKAIISDIASSLLSSLPDKVSDALKEVGELDLYNLVVGSIYYKLAGLLLPIIYMIMAANNLIVGQVDSGSMAYVLSTSTKRQTVVFTQAVYLVGSLFAMFCMTTVTGCVCMAILNTQLSLTYGQMILLNVGAFFVLFCLSGLCFLTSCWFDRSKRAMALGGGLSIFALVASMLGLFGSPILPSIVRMSSLNYFNYITVISLFDVASITAGTLTFVWKLAILLAAGLVGYIVGSWKFVKKDLPL